MSCHKIMYLKNALEKGVLNTIAWIHDIKKEGDYVKIILRDSTGAYEFKVNGEWTKVLRSITRESLVKVQGYLKENNLQITHLEILLNAPEHLPIDVRNPLPDDVERFTKHSYLVIRSPKYSKVLRVQHWILYYAREFLINRGFVELLSPIISPCSDPGLQGARKLRTEFYGYEYELMSSVIMFKQASAAALEKIFFMARNVREEPIENLKTKRHLCEFTQLDVEWAFASMEDVMDLAEDLIIFVLKKIKDKCKDIIEEFNPDLQIPPKPFKKMRYDEVVEMLRGLGFHTPQGKELTQEGEEELSKRLKEPLWITNYPVSSRGFYYIPEFNNPKYNRDFNLIMPRGFGEVIDGGEREYRVDKIEERIKSLGEPLNRYKWFLDLASIGIPPSAGFGLGIERFTRYVLNLKYIWETAPFPKVPGIVPTP